MTKTDEPHEPETNAQRVDSRLAAALVTYTALAAHEDVAVRVGRSAKDGPKEDAIWRDVLAKLNVGAGQRILDVGVGNGSIAARWAEMADDLDLRLTFCDFPAVLERLDPELRSNARIELQVGQFPFSLDPTFLTRKFDRVLLYSVLHYTDDPDAVVDAAIGLLAPGGRLLLGDIPNLDKKGRFLASATGRAFDADYKGVPPDRVPSYSSYADFTKEALGGGAAPLHDHFALTLMKRARARGLHAYVCEQPDGLPFSKTREDILIVAPDA